MKSVIVLFLTFFTISSSAQLTKNVNNFKEQTFKIMNILSIPIRTHLEKDDSITIKLKNDFSLNAEFARNEIAFVIKNGILDTAGRWYINPYINITPPLDSIISNTIDTSKKVYNRACVSIIHELTHYFQKTYFIGDYFEPINNSDYKKYISQQIEFEAYAVSSYYYLRKFKNKKLKKIIRMKTNTNEKFKALINAFWAEVYPWRPLVF